MEVSKQETPFRIGGVYRNKQGDAVRLSVTSSAGRDMERPGQAYANSADKRRMGLGVCCLMTGKNIRAPLDLIPGELDEVDGEWLPVDELRHAEDIEAILDEMIEQTWAQADAIRAANAEPKRPALDWNKPTPFDPFKDFAVTYDSTEQVCFIGSFGKFRSPDFTNGPADHLNAARHQMAGMKG